MRPGFKKTRQHFGTLRVDKTLSIRRFKPDIESMVEGVVERLAMPDHELPSHFYLNPSATVASNQGTRDFFETARSAQAEWCRRTQNLFSRRVRRSTREWVAVEGQLPSKHRYWQRAACWHGLLFVDGHFIPPSRWPDGRLARGDQPRLHSIVPISHEQVVQKLLLLTQPEYWQKRFAAAGLSCNFHF